MNTTLKSGIILLMILALIGCNSDGIKFKQSSIKNPTGDRKILDSPQEYINNHPDNMNARVFSRYDNMLIESITAYHNVNGSMPKNLAEFFSSDLCLIMPREIKTGLPFSQADAIDITRPENIVYKYTDPHTAELSILLPTYDGQYYIHTYKWDRERFWRSLAPPEFNFKGDKEEWNRIIQTDPPVVKKNEAMLNILMAEIGLALADYYDQQKAFPPDVDNLFLDKWGTFRHEPWDNFQYDDPAKKIPNRIFSFDKAQNIYYLHTAYKDKEYDYAMKYPANFIEEPGRSLNMVEVKDYNSLKTDFFADAESLKNLS